MVITDPRTRSSRRGRVGRRAMVVALAVTAVAVAVWASAAAPLPASRQVQSELTYIAEVHGPLAEEVQLAGVVAQVRSGGASLRRDQMVTDLVELDETAARDATTIASTDSIGHISLDTSALAAAARDWSQGARLFEVGILSSIGPGTTPAATGPGVVTPAAEGTELWALASSVATRGAAVTTLQDAGAHMSAGDAAYQRFASSVSASHLRTAHLRGKGREKGALLADVRWDPDSTWWSAPSLAAFEQSLAGSTSLAPVHQVTLVLASLDPPPIPGQGLGGVPTIVGTGAISVTAVVANSGNVDATGVVVQVTVEPVGAAAPGALQAAPLVRRQSVELEPGEDRAVEFSGLNLIPGHTFLLSTTVSPATGQASVAGTTVTQQFSVES